MKNIYLLCLRVTRVVHVPPQDTLKKETTVPRPFVNLNKVAECALAKFLNVFLEVAAVATGSHINAAYHPCFPRCHSCSVHHDPDLVQLPLFIHLRKRKVEAGDLQDPEYFLRDLLRYRGPLEGSLLPSPKRSRGGKGASTLAY